MSYKSWPLIPALLGLTLLMGGCDSGGTPAKGGASQAESTAPAIEPNVGDIAAGKRLAGERCGKCHGVEGVSARSGSPFIAGLKQEYLVRSLLAYKDGSRKNAQMLEVIDRLSTLQLADVTAWYASLDTPWKGAVADAKSKAILLDKAARQAAAKGVPACSSCHNRAMIYKQEQAIPSLAGMPLEYFVPSLKSYLNGKRHDEIMGQFKISLSDKDIYNLGAYYAGQVPERAPAPTRGDAAAGKAAARHCAGCHGYDGNSLNPHVPNLAGQTADYLRKALHSYRDGKRSEELMKQPVAHLSDSDIANLAAYYAQQQPESPLYKDIESPQAFNPLPGGRRIAASCDSCHGNNGNSRIAGIPSLSGQSVPYLVTATRDYQEGRRDNKVMHDIVSFLSDTSIERVAYYYAMQPPQARRGDTDVSSGEKLSSACATCHGEGGVSKDPATTPNLAGQDADYIINATQAYASGKRHNESMAKVGREIKEDELRQIAKYFASQPPHQVATWLPEDPALTVAKRCSRCHGEGGHSTTPGVPPLAGQSEPYIILALREYQEGIRKDSMMEPMAYGLSMIEIKAIAAYYARQ